MDTAPLNHTTTTAAPPPPRRPEAHPADHAPAHEPAHAAGPTQARDTAHTGPLAIAEPTHVDVEHVAVPPPPHEEHHGFFGKLWDGAKHAATGVVHAAETVAHVTSDVVGAGVHAVEEGYHHGDGVLGALGDGLHAAGHTAVAEVINPVLDHAIGKADKAHDTAAGALGPLLTNRLAVGDSVDIKIEAGATLPTELVGAPNVKLDGGGTLKIKRVAAQDANGQPIIGADGQPETRLEVELQAFGRAGAAYSASVGFDATVGVAGHDVGAKASARAEAEAGLTGRLDLKMRFNPNDAQDMGDLLAMTRATAATGAAASIPGVGALIAGLDHADYARSMDSMGRHLEEFGGEGGLYAQANASAKLGLGVFKARPQGDPAVAGGDRPNLVDRAAQAGMDRAHTALLAKMNMQVANIGASLGGQATVGSSHNYRTGETTYSISASGMANAGGAVLGAGEQKGVAANRKINLVFGPDGNLKDVVVQQSMTKTEFQGAMTTVQDVFGRPINPGVVAGIGKSDTITVNYKLRPEIVQQIRDAHDMQGMTAAAVVVGNAAITRDRYKLDLGDIVTDHRDQVDFHFNFGLSLGAQVGVRAGVTLGHDQERVIG